jgi:hypothetical protein
MDGAAAVGTTTKYAREDHVHPSDTSKAALTQVVRYDTAQALTAAQQVQARANVYAAPMDALAYNGMQINGSMEVCQFAGPVTVPTGSIGAHIVDGWKVEKTGTSVLSAYQTTTLFAGLPNCIQFSATTPQPTIGSDYVRFTTRIEGYRVARLGWGTASAQPVTVGFWVRMSLPGTYQALIHNVDASALSAWMPFTVAASMVWQWVTITFLPVTSGTWPVDNTTGLQLVIEVASFSTPNTIGATGQYAAITGVVVLPGIEAPSAARSALIMRPYDQELVTCLRYFEKDSLLLQSPAPATMSWPYTFKAVKRATPTITPSGITYVNASGLAVNSPTPNSTSFQLTASAGAGYAVFSFTADARL